MGKIKTFKIEDTESLKNTDNFLIWVPVDSDHSFITNVAFETMELAENVCGELGIDFEYIIPLHYIYQYNPKDIAKLFDDFVSILSGDDTEDEEDGTEN